MAFLFWNNVKFTLSYFCEKFEYGVKHDIMILKIGIKEINIEGEIINV